MSRERCKICTHPESDAINCALAAGQHLKQLAPKYGVTCSSLSRHKLHHLDMPMPTVSPNELAQEAEMWRARADQVWRQAERDADVRGQVQSLQAGLRSLEFAVKQAEKESSKPVNENGPRLTIEDCDRMVARLIEQNAERTDKLALEKAKGLADHWTKPDERETPDQRAASAHKAAAYFDMYTLFERCHENPELRTAVLAFASEWRFNVSNQATAAN